MPRMGKVNNQLKREISVSILTQLTDPRLEFITITHVETSKDLRSAKVFYSILGNAQKREEAQQGLDGARGIIRKLVGERLIMRCIPELSFIYDRTLELSARIEETLKEIKDAQADHADSEKK